MLERLLPIYHFSERHWIEIDATPPVVWRAMHRVKVRGSGLVRGAIWLRMLPVSRERKYKDSELIFNLDSMTNFLRLGSAFPVELCLGMSGQFWKLSGGLAKIRKEDFPQTIKGHGAKLIWSFYFKKCNRGTILITETRVWCSSFYAWIRFLPYWVLIRPFSGMIRLQILRGIAQESLTIIPN